MARVVEAEQFVVKDSKGKVRTILGVGQDGSPSITLLDQSGRQRVVVYIGPTGHPGVSLFDDQGRQRSVFGIGPNAAVGIVADENGQACWSADSSRG